MINPCNIMQLDVKKDCITKSCQDLGWSYHHCGFGVSYLRSVEMLSKHSQVAKEAGLGTGSTGWCALVPFRVRYVLFNNCLNFKWSVFSRDSLLNRFVQSGDLMAGPELSRSHREKKAI